MNSHIPASLRPGAGRTPYRAYTPTGPPGPPYDNVTASPTFYGPPPSDKPASQSPSSSYPGQLSYRSVPNSSAYASAPSNYPDTGRAASTSPAPPQPICRKPLPANARILASARPSVSYAPVSQLRLIHPYAGEVGRRSKLSRPPSFGKVAFPIALLKLSRAARLQAGAQLDRVRIRAVERSGYGPRRQYLTSAEAAQLPCTNAFRSRRKDTRIYSRLA